MRKLSLLSAVTAGIAAASSGVVQGAVWIGPSASGNSGSWNTAANWNPSDIPDSTGENATFTNTPQVGNRAVTADGSQIVGSIDFNHTAVNALTTSINTGTAGSTLTFDETGAGPATVTTSGTGTGNNTIAVAVTLADSLVANVNQTTSTSGAGSLNLTAAMSGPGGFTKNGDGLATLGTGAKTYAGATVINAGRLRVSLAAAPTATSSFTINAGGQLTQISAGSYTFGSGPLNLNGTGPLAGPQAGFPGAIRNDTNLAVTINNAVNLQSNTLLHVQGSATGSLTFPGAVSGPGSLTLTAPGSDANQGQLVLGAANSYVGGTFVNGGLLIVNAAGGLGSGNVTVDDALAAAAVARLQLVADDAIADTAVLTLAGGGTGGVADENFAILNAGVDDTVGGLILGGFTETGIGTYGATGSGANFIRDEYFSGAGVVRLVPEPATLSVLALGAAGLIRRRSAR